jgi:hypothetical protein
MKLAIGSRVRWESMAGVKEGEITNIVLEPSAGFGVTPWIYIACIITKDEKVTTIAGVRLCASDSNLKMMRVSLV